MAPVVSAQLTRTELNCILVKPSANTVKTATKNLPSPVMKSLQDVLRNGVAIYG